MQLLNSTWYSRQYTDLWYSRQYTDLWYNHQYTDLWYNHQYMVHLLCTQCVIHLARIHCRGWDTHYTKTQCRLSLSASSQETSLPVLAARISIQNNPKRHTTCVLNTKNGGNLCLRVLQRLKASLGMFTTTASCSVCGCGTQLSLSATLKLVPSEMIEKLSPVHKHHIFTEFGLNL